jgi:hypothetical protein
MDLGDLLGRLVVVVPEEDCRTVGLLEPQHGSDEHLVQLSLMSEILGGSRRFGARSHLLPLGAT